MCILTDIAADTINADTIDQLEALEQEVIDRMAYAKAPSFRSALTNQLAIIRNRMEAMECVY